MGRQVQQVELPATVRPLLLKIGQLAEELRVQAYAVGGCVRDWRLGIPHGVDLDVTVEGCGVTLAQATARALGGTVTVHQQFGTATVRWPSAHAPRLDVATCRREVYTKPGAYPRVSPGTIDDDLSRRDFTVNAMAVALNPARVGRLVDPFHGAQDLARRRLRVLHARSFLDDPSRILRGARFAHRFTMRWDPRTRVLMQQALAAGALRWLNPGRIRKEYARAREEPDPDRCLEQLEALVGNPVAIAAVPQKARHR